MQIGKRNMYLTKNHIGRNEMWRAVDNHKYVCHKCSKEFLDLNLVIDKISFFYEMAPNYTYRNRNFKSVIGNW